MTSVSAEPGALSERRGNVLLITINRPDARNAVNQAVKEVGMVVEGINALPAACKLAKKYKVEMPIVNAVDDILSGRLAARDALATMMGRQLKQE